MHELAICEAVLRQVLAIAAAHNASGVARISLTIGPLAGIEPHLLLNAFPLVAAGTLCAAAQVELKTAAVRVHCKICGSASSAKANRLLCAGCGTWRVTLVSGDEMLLSNVELLQFEPEPLREDAHV